MTTTTTHEIVCDRGHRETVTVTDDRCGLSAEFDSGHFATMAAKDSYAYRNGGCCYRAAVDLLHDLTR